MFKTPKTILLTGGTSGIGLALLKQLHGQGHTLIVVARSPHKLSRVQEDYVGVTTYVCDLSSRLQIESLVDNITGNHPELSILINNAGIQYTPTFIDDDFNFDSIEHETTINFLAPVWLSCLLLPALIDNKASAAIVNISSGLAFAPKTASSVYCASKAAIHSFSQSLRYQLSNTNVRIHEAIMPLVDTPMTAGRGSHKLSADEAARQIILGINNIKPEIYVGKARFLPFLMRISPALVKRMMRRF